MGAPQVGGQVGGADPAALARVLFLETTPPIPLRDLFAAAALAGLLASARQGTFFSELAEDAYDCAEVMLRERARRAAP